MAINWAALRVWSGSREDSFEDICCQLAAVEPVPTGAKFVRKGTPDGGVECYWGLPGGNEYGWQAKFFEAPPTPKQWSEVDESVETALVKHPRLIRYIVCMAVDRSDSRVTGHKTFLDRWNERVAKWKKWSTAKRMSVEFEYWGNHELETRLSREENRGRHWYWFNAEQFTVEWFRRQLDVAIKNAGDRYTPALNVELPIAQTFDALGRTTAFHARLGKLYESLRDAFRWLPQESEPAEVQIALNSLRTTTSRLFEALDAVLLPLEEEPKLASVRPIPWTDITAQVETLSTQASDLRNVTQRLADLRSANEAPKKESSPQDRALETVSAYALRTYIAASHLDAFCGSPETTVSNRPELLLVGSAGQGKTHFLCDIAERDMAAGRPRLLFHGSHFTDAEPWSQIITMLGLRCTVDVFLGALEAAGQFHGSRVLILIDALNEGEGRTLWAKHLPGMLSRLVRTHWVGIAVSVRDSYEELVIPSGLVPDQLTRIVHTGFQEHEYEAVNRFFAHFHIQPTAPLLVPEFSNPLFLRLFCKSVRDLGLNQVPAGLRGMTAILGTFLDAINRRLSDPSRMDYDERSHPVRKATEAVVQLIAERSDYFLSRDAAIAVVNAVHPATGYDRSLFRNLVTEGLLSESRWTSENKVTEVVHFTYERFADHFLAQYLLERHLDRKEPKKAFGPRARIGKLLKDEHASWRYAGLIEALSVQLPERVGKELVELAPQVKQFHQGQLAFIQSLIWRDSKAFQKATSKYLDSLWATHLLGEVLDALITVAPVPDHPLNANRLHDILLSCGMPDRDRWWSTFLHEQWDATRAVRRLIEWAWTDSDKSALSDEVIILTGTTLAWFLTSSHRHLRDRTTKALIKLFESRVYLLPRLLERFREVDDPHVSERLIAVAYGSTMRAPTLNGLKEVAGAVARQVFSNERLRPHLLTRDYGRCVIELARHRGVIGAQEFSESAPPYSSRWPDMQIPSIETLSKWGKFKGDDAKPEEQAQHAIYWEITDRHRFSDFAKHVGDFTNWTSVRVGEPAPPPMRARCEAFLGRLSNAQRAAFDGYSQTVRAARLIRPMSVERQLEALGRSFTTDELDQEVSDAVVSFERTVAKNHQRRDEFRTLIRHYVEHPEEYHLEHRFDGDAALRWMVQRVIEYGWTQERFGRFDASVRRLRDILPDRPRGERIGAKYQWIAYRELLARLADNFRLRKDRYGSDELKVYSGPWDIGYGTERDIDPSVTIQRTQSERKPSNSCWWSPMVYTNWSNHQDDLAWLQSDDDLPAPPGLLSVTHPDDGSLWYVLDTHINWQQPARPGRKDYDYPHRGLYYFLWGYLVRKQNAGPFFKWAKRQNFMEKRTPEPPDVHGVSLGEFYWSPAFRTWQAETGPNWRGHNSDFLPNEVLLTTLNYIHESSGEDRSIEETLRIRVPTPELASGMGLRWCGVEGEYCDDRTRLAAIDPSVSTAGPGALVVRADLLTQFLAKAGLELVWTLLGEKHLIGGNIGPSDHGWLEVNGAYRLTSSGVVGGFSAKHQRPAPIHTPRRRRIVK